MKRFVFTADIEKMYRQILVAEEDRKLQLIMWRKASTDPIKYYQLCTVTYGTKSAPYLAVKCLRKLAEEEGHKYPKGASAINNFYIDDVMTGSDELDEAVKIQTQLRSLLKEGGFHLRKWCANYPRLLQNIPNEDLELQLDLSSISNEHIKTLGLVWQPVLDILTIVTNLKDQEYVTKRSILSDITQIFD